MLDLEWITIPAGEYGLGLDTAQRNALSLRFPLFGSEWYAASPARRVAHRAFQIARDPVTNAQFCAFLKAHSPEGRGSWFWKKSPYALIEVSCNRYRPKPGFEHHPMSGIYFAGAEAFATWAGARLPSETEWEIAARGGSCALWPWGDTGLGQCNHYDAPGPFPPEIRPNFNDGRGPTPVVYFGANALGCRDMIGNLWEWCAVGPETPSGTAPVKGGSWNDIAPIAFLPAFRHNVPLGYRQSYCFGMRLARSVP